MTIKEMEAYTGLTRANIRFYESEGLLTPQRGSNGYRDYSEEDGEILKRVKLLRSLRMPLEEILELHRGEAQLIPAMDRRIAALQKEQGEIGKAIGVCREIRSDGCEYRSLNAQHYLDSLNIPREDKAKVLSVDVYRPPYCPWRRYFARMFDWMLCGTIWNLVLLLAFHVRPSGREPVWQLVDFFVKAGLIFVVEPALLHFFGTTPGKWILGISVLDNMGDKLDYGDAMARLWLIFGQGLGYGVPIYEVVRLYKSYAACGVETLEWEYGSDIHLKDRKWWRIVALILAHAVLFGVLYLGMGAAQIPKNRGDITIAQFCENYNQLAKYHRMNDDGMLSDTGAWVQPWGGMVITLSDTRPPVFTFSETDGVLKTVHYRVGASNAVWITNNYQNQMLLCALAFTGTERGFGPFSASQRNLIRYIEENGSKSFAYQDRGFSLTCEIAYSGYTEGPNGLLISEENTEQNYSLDFVITKG